MNNILEVKNLNKQYDTFSLKNVSFRIPRGYIMGFIGPNGAGKTTTIKAILNMISSESDEIKLFGLTHKQDEMKIKDSIGVVMDLPFYVDDWKLKDVEAAVSPFYSAWNHNQYMRLLKRFGLLADKKVKELSRGMKVKLMLAVALSHDAKLLILDEPTSGLDPVARDELMDILQEFVTDESKGILFSTHITADLEKIADYITFIIDGKIKFTGVKEDLLESYLLVKGGVSDISKEQKRMIIGYREHSAGFDGMIATGDIKKLPKNITTEKVLLDDIIIYINKEGHLHE